MAFDVIIAGAGIIGSSIAWRLSQDGVRVLLLDAGRVGGEASSAGAGMLALGAEVEERSAWAELAAEGLRRYPAFVAELEEESGVHIDFQRLGGVELPLSPKHWPALLSRAERQAGLGIPSCPLTPDDLRKHAPLARPDVAGAIFYPQDALVDPRDVMAALRAACLARTVEIREGVRVTAIQPGTGSVRVETSAGPWESRAAVLAAGAWSSQIDVRGMQVPQAIPVRGHLVGYQLEPHSLGPLLRCGPTYLLQRSSGFTVAGSSSEQVGFDRTLDPAVVAEIQVRAACLLPALAGCRPAETWLGFRPGVEGESLAIGRAADSLWLAYGHYRNGILMAPATAHRLTEDITAKRERSLSAHPGRL